MHDTAPADEHRQEHPPERQSIQIDEREIKFAENFQFMKLGKCDWIVVSIRRLV